MSNHLTDPTRLTLTEAITAIQTKTLSHQELYDAFSAKITEQNTDLNIYLTQNPTAPIESKTIDASLPLAGLPIAIKDNIATKGIRTTASSTLLDSFIPPYDATVTTKLKQAGGVVQAKTNLDAWAHGSSTETSQYGATKNPRNTDYLPGGSSGGSAAAVAADFCLASLGTETAGSIRQPAAWCGAVGLKPTYGRVSRHGIVAMASSTDSPGPITKTVEDAALLLSVIAGNDPYDATTSTQPVAEYQNLLNAGIKGLKIGVMYHEFEELAPLMAHFKDAYAIFEQLGATVEFVSAMDPRYAISVYTVVQRAEVSSNLARFDGIRYGANRDAFGDEARRRIMLGTFTLSKGNADDYYTLAQKVRTLFIQDYQRLFATYDILLAPTAPTFAQPAGASASSNMYGELADVLVEPSSVAGLPGISVPCYRDPETNLFLGLNIMAPLWREDLCLQAAAAFEAATNWNTWRTNK